MLMLYLAALDTDDERDKMTQLYEDHKYALLSYGLKIVKDQALAEDAVHSAFLSMIGHKEKMFSLSCRDFRSWSVVIVKHKCMDILRKRQKETPLTEVDFALVSEESEVEMQVITKMEYQRLRVLIAQLDETSRVILDMKYIRNLSYKEIGVLLDITEKNVDMRIYRAKQRVRKLLQQEMVLNEG